MDKFIINSFNRGGKTVIEIYTDTSINGIETSGLNKEEIKEIISDLYLFIEELKNA